MRLLRMTTRRWMVVIAIVAIAFGAAIMRERSVAYRGKANRYALEEAKVRTWGKHADQMTAVRKKELRDLEAFAEGYGGRFRADWKPLIDPAIRSVSLASEEAEKCLRWAAHWGALRVKYERAARRPWLPLEPDPPRPD